LCQSDDFGSSSIKSFVHGDIDFALVFPAEFVKHVESLVSIGACQPNNYGHFDVYLLGSLDDTLSDSVAFHDTSKYIDEDGFHIFVLVEDLEAYLDLLGSGTTTHVQEVGWLASLQLDDVHGRHSQTSTVHHAPNVAI
jgi:hypothetical protein